MKVKVFKNQLAPIGEMMGYFVFEGVRTEIVQTMPALCHAVDFYTDLKAKSERYSDASGKITVSMDDTFIPVFSSMLDRLVFAYIKEHPDISMDTVTEITNLYKQIKNDNVESTLSITDNAFDLNQGEIGDDPVASDDENTESDMADIESIQNMVKEMENLPDEKDPFEDDIHNTVVGMMEIPEKDNTDFPSSMGYVAEDPGSNDISEGLNLDPDFDFDMEI